MNKFLWSILFSFLLASCSSVEKNKLKKELVRGEESFNYADKNGQFVVKLSSGFNKNKNHFFTKRVLESANKTGDNVLEQSVVLSDIGSLNKKGTILRPKISQYNVWFEGKKYFTELKFDAQKKAIDIKLISPESQWNGTKIVKLPSTKALYCFFSQVIECAKTAGFLDKAIKNEAGTMNFYVIWEGYPYYNETLSNFPSEVLSKAQLEYDGKTKDVERRFNLKVNGQSIFYVVDQKEQMKKMFWVSEGISMISKLSKQESNNSESDLKEIGGSFE